MRNIHDALAAFWGGFFNRSAELFAPEALKAYQSGYAVEQPPQGPRPPELPYITYDIARSSFGGFTLLSGRIWTRGTSWGLVNDVLEQASEKVPESGIILDVGTEGAVWLLRSNPFTDYLPPEGGDQMNKAGVIRLIVKNYMI